MGLDFYRILAPAAAWRRGLPALALWVAAMAVHATPPGAEPAGNNVNANTNPTSANSPAAADPLLNLLAERGALSGAAVAVAIASTPAALANSTSASAASDLLSKMRDTASDLVMTAMSFIGVRYRYGGTNVDTGFDCSGFTRYVFQNSLGIALPRRAADQANAPEMQQINPDDLQPGDLVFFNTLRRAFSHVGIYIGEGKFIHSPSRGTTVRVDDMSQSYWVQRFSGARRPPAPAAQP